MSKDDDPMFDSEMRGTPLTRENLEEAVRAANAAYERSLLQQYIPIPVSPETKRAIEDMKDSDFELYEAVMEFLGYGRRRKP